MMTKTYAWSYTLKIVNVANITQPLANQKKTTLVYGYI